MRSAMTLLNLPTELLHHICSFITIPSLLPLCSVSKDFNTLVLSILNDRHRFAASLKCQSLCYHLYQPIDRFGVPLVRAVPRAIITPPAQKLEYGSNWVNSLKYTHETLATFTPSIECRSVLFYDARGADHVNSLSERRIQIDGDENFAQLVYKFEIIQYESSEGRCCGSSILLEGVRRVFRDALEESIKAQSEGRDGLVLALGEEEHVGLRTSVRRSFWDRETGDATYYIKVHGKFCPVSGGLVGLKADGVMQRLWFAQHILPSEVRMHRSRLVLNHNRGFRRWQFSLGMTLLDLTDLRQCCNSSMYYVKGIGD
jgi:hypothetical protein